MSLNRALFIATVVSHEHAISGSLATASLMGNFVTNKAVGATINDADVLELANETDGFFLTRDHLVADAARDELQVLSPRAVGIVTPTIVDVDQVSAHRLIEGEFEGDLYLDASVDAATTKDQEIFFKNGKIAEVAAGETPRGVIVKQLTPTDAGNSRRVLIRFSH